MPAHSETIISGKVHDSVLIGSTGIISPAENIAERYNIFGASELVVVGSESFVPVRIINPTNKPVKLYSRTKIAYLSPVEPDIATFELKDNSEAKEPDNSFKEGRDYSQLPDLSDSVLKENEKEPFMELFRKYSDLFPTSKLDLGRTSLVSILSKQLVVLLNKDRAVPILKRARK